MERIVARAAARVDLAGGSLDLWPLGLLVEGAMTVNLAVSLLAKVECVKRRGPVKLRGDGWAGAGSRRSKTAEEAGTEYEWEEGSPPGGLGLVERFCRHYGVLAGWEIITSSDSPPGAGLGGSSALSVALASALGRIAGREEPPERIASVCRDLEAAHLRIPTGVQDFWPALLGGVLCIEYRPGGEKVSPLPIPLKALASRLVVAYSGESRLSAKTNWALVKRFIDGEEDAKRALEGIASAAREMRGALEEGDLDRAGRLLGEEWEHRKTLADGIATTLLDELVGAGLKAGAIGGKACGAGGGGCLAFICQEGGRAAVEAALERLGGRILQAHPIERGVRLEVWP